MSLGGRGYFLAAALYVVAVFALQPFLGRAVDGFKERFGEAGFEGTMLVAVAVCGLAVAALAARVWQRVAPWQRVVLVAGLALYALGVARLDVPQERLHYAEFGLISGLIWVGLAARADRARPRWWLFPAVAAVLGTGALGYLDETLQGAFYERRYFDWADVRLNVQAAALGLWVAIGALPAVSQRERQAGSRPR